MWLFKCSQVNLRRNFCNSFVYKSGIDLLSLDKGHSPAREEFYFDFLYGIHPISCAIEAKRRSIDTVFYRRDLVEHSKRVREILERCWAENVATKAVSQDKIDSILAAKGKPHQGIVAKVSRLYCTPTTCTKEYITGLLQHNDSSIPVWVLLNEIHDPMNFGSILRTAYFLGCHKIFVTSHKSCPLTPVVSKASSGVMELIAVHSVNNTTQFCHLLRDLNWDVVGTGSKKSETGISNTPITSFRLENPTLVILGNEGRGLPDQLVNICSRQLYIESRKDLNRNVDSMNVSAAAGIILHNLLNCYDRK